VPNEKNVGTTSRGVAKKWRCGKQSALEQPLLVAIPQSDKRTNSWVQQKGDKEVNAHFATREEGKVGNIDRMSKQRS
jgi:hypothetical protein